jgi:hypothetical protein
MELLTAKYLTTSLPEAQSALQSLYNPSLYAYVQPYETRSLFANMLFNFCF